MAGTQYRIPLFDLLMALCTAVDLYSPVVANHHKRVAYIALRLAQELGMKTAQRDGVALAGMIHDIGAFSLKERQDIIALDLTDVGKHAEVGYAFLRRFEPFAATAEIIRYHHLAWANGAGAQANGQAVPALSHLLHLADRIEVLILADAPVLSQVERIHERIVERTGNVFVPEHVQAFEQLSVREYFWLDAVSPAVEMIMAGDIQLSHLDLDIEGLLGLSRMLSQIIDFKSPYTSAHSSGVAASAAKLAELAGFSTDEQKQVMVAGYLHDLGKLAVPAEILNKPAALTDEEYSVMRAHSYHTRRILDSVEDLKHIVAWASAHHERLDGAGYPFHEEAAGLPMAARIMAVADVFTALAEDRPYRRSMGEKEVLSTLDKMAAEGKLDERVITLLKDGYEAVDAARQSAQQRAQADYAEFAHKLK